MSDEGLSGERACAPEPGYESESGYDADAQVLSAVLRVLQCVPPGGVVYWGCEYVCPASDEGTQFYAGQDAGQVSAGSRDAVTLTFGRGDVSAELDVTVSPARADGLALWLGEWQVPRETPFRFPRAHLLWVGYRSDSKWLALVDESADQSVTHAMSWPALGAEVSALVALYRPDVSVELDASWEHHRHPLSHIWDSAPRSSTTSSRVVPAGEDWASEELVRDADDEDFYTLWVGKEGEPSVKASGQVMDVLLDLEIAHQRFLGSLSERERAQYEYEERWMKWTDGTFDPDGWDFP